MSPAPVGIRDNIDEAGRALCAAEVNTNALTNPDGTKTKTHLASPYTQALKARRGYNGMSRRVSDAAETLRSRRRRQRRSAATTTGIGIGSVANLDPTRIAMQSIAMDLYDRAFDAVRVSLTASGVRCGDGASRYGEKQTHD